jgi:hypothetical protein
LRVRVQILPLALRERKGQKILRILVVYCNTVVEYLTYNPNIKSSNPTTGSKRDKVTRSFFRILVMYWKHSGRIL